MRPATIFFSLVIVAAAKFVELTMGGTINFEWKVTSITWSPDGVIGSVLAINGLFPGPTIKAKTGDNIVVDLTNGLDNEGLSIHWHGIKQLGTPWADGAANISQCPIQPGKKFKYEFKVDKAGTYFYHGHYGMQRTGGLYGMLIVDDDTEKAHISTKYDGEFSLLLSDWWHKGYKQQEDDLAQKPMVWVGEPQSLLINGRGQYNCSLAGAPKPACSLTGYEQYAPDIQHVEPNKTYRIRLASTTSLASLSFAIGNHQLELIEADGNLVNHIFVDSMYIFPGQTYSMLIRTNNQSADPSGSFWVSIGVIGRDASNTALGLTVLAYDYPNSNYSRTSLPTTPPPVTPAWNNYSLMKSFSRKIVALKGSSPTTPPSNVTKTIHLLNLQNRVDLQTKWSLNNISLLLPPTPFLASLVNNITWAYSAIAPPESFDMKYDIKKPPPNVGTVVASTVYKLKLKENDVVDIILQNANALKPNVSEIHPWHLHGHDFWVLGYGEGMFDGKMELMNLVDPPLRNTDVLYPYGYTHLRLVADNPGVWAFHCHIEMHMEMGMGVVLSYGLDRFVKVKVPQEGLKCGLNK